MMYNVRNLLLGVKNSNGIENKRYTSPIIRNEENNYEIELFNSVQVQTIEFCNLRCNFCPNHYMIWDRLDDKKKGIPYKAMSIENYTKIVKNLARLNFKGRFSPYLMNEPLVDRDRIVEFISIAKEHLSKECTIRINTNGTYLRTKLLGDMINAGLDYIQIDDYIGDSNAEKLIKACEPFQGVNGKCDIMLSSNYNVQQVTNREEGKKGAPPPHFGPFSHWNRAGNTNVNPDMPVPQKNCGYPSSQMYIKWDGGAILCCCDWEYEVVHGNVLKTSIEEVWTNGSYKHYRDTLKKGRRDLLDNCRKCNKGAFSNEEERLENLKKWNENKFNTTR